MADLNKSASEARKLEAKTAILAVGLLAYVGAVIVVGSVMGDNMSTHLSERLQAVGWLSAGLWVVSAIAVLGATHFSAAGPQRWAAWAIWIVDLGLMILNFLSQGFSQKGIPPDWVKAFMDYGWFANIVLLIAGWGAYFISDPSHKLRDLIAHAEEKVLSHLLTEADELPESSKMPIEFANRQTAEELIAGAQARIRTQLNLSRGLNPPRAEQDIIQPPVVGHPLASRRDGEKQPMKG